MSSVHNTVAQTVALCPSGPLVLTRASATEFWNNTYVLDKGCNICELTYSFIIVPQKEPYHKMGIFDGYT